MVNLVETSNVTFSNSHKSKHPAIHISTLPTRNNQVDIPSFTIPLPYNLGNVKKVGEQAHFDINLSTSENNQTNQWDNRAVSTFSLMNLKPLIENSHTIEIPVELKYDGDIKGENRINFDIPAAVQNASIESNDMLTKVNTHDGQTISQDFQIETYQSYNNINDKRMPENSFHNSMLEDTNKCEFTCDNEFLCKTFDKDEINSKQNQFEDCNLLVDNENGTDISNYNSNL